MAQVIFPAIVVPGSTADPAEPSSPIDGQIWVDTDGTAPTTVVTRWSKSPTNGTTTLSGTDDTTNTLAYTPGYEQVFLNGVLLSRGSDYTATTGTSVVLSVATITSDIVEIIAALQVAYTDTITTAAAATTYVAKALTTTTGDIIYASAANTPARLGIGSSAQVLTVASGIPSWATPASAGGTWAAWTPTLTNLTLGNGTLTSRYAAVGQIVNFSFFFTFGSTSSMGTNPSISWPVTPASTAAAKAAQIHVWNQDVSSQANLATAHPYARTTSVFILHTITSSATTSTEADVTVTATAPFTWTTGDLIWISGTYESV